jgi:hypothetical protein
MASQSSVFSQATVRRIGSIVGGRGGISTRREDIYKNGIDHKEEGKNDDRSFKRCELRPGKAYN